MSKKDHSDHHHHQPSFSKNETLAKIMPVIEKVAYELNLVPVEVDFVKEGGRWHLRIFIYSHSHGITHEDCEALTKGIDEYLDQLIPIAYYLEVSSPGLERKLKSPKEYNIFKGKRADIKLKQPLEDGSKHFMSIIVEYVEGIGIRLLPEGSDTVIVVNEKNISSARLKADFEF